MSTENQEEAEAPNQKWFVKILFWLWVPAVLLVISFQMGSHLLTMPEPTNIDKMASALDALPDTEGSPWRMYHVIYEDCWCAQAVKDQLIARGPQEGIDEHILYIGEKKAFLKHAGELGYHTLRVTQEELKTTYGIEAAPMLVVLREGAEVAYVGGYYKKKTPVDPQDLRILAEVKAGTLPEPMPLFGCAVSTDLQYALDPLGLQYVQREMN